MATGDLELTTPRRRGRRRAAAAPGAARGAARRRVLDRGRARLLGAHLADGRDLGAGPAVDEHDASASCGRWSRRAHFWYALRRHGARLGARPRHRDRARRPDRDRCSARATSPRRAFRVPIEFLRPIPSAALIPRALPHARDDPQERGLPRERSARSGRCSSRRCTASATSTRSRSTPRGRSASAAFERLYRITLPSAVPYIVDRPPHLLDGRADPRVHGRALHGHCRASGRRSTSRTSFGLDVPALRATRSPPASSASPSTSRSRRSSGACCAGIPRSGWGRA